MDDLDNGDIVKVTGTTNRDGLYVYNDGLLTKLKQENPTKADRITEDWRGKGKRKMRRQK